MPDNAEINFDALATLRKWPSLNNERVSASVGARPYMIIEGTLDECIRKFMAMPVMSALRSGRMPSSRRDAADHPGLGDAI